MALLLLFKIDQDVPDQVKPIRVLGRIGKFVRTQHVVATGLDVVARFAVCIMQLDGVPRN
jgi:hypothetical protein